MQRKKAHLHTYGDYPWLCNFFLFPSTNYVFILYYVFCEPLQERKKLFLWAFTRTKKPNPPCRTANRKQKCHSNICSCRKTKPMLSQMVHVWKPVVSSQYPVSSRQGTIIGRSRCLRATRQTTVFIPVGVRQQQAPNTQGSTVKRK